VITSLPIKLPYLFMIYNKIKDSLRYPRINNSSRNTKHTRQLKCAIVECERCEVDVAYLCRRLVEELELVRELSRSYIR
jgi:hypothetical protein